MPDGIPAQFKQEGTPAFPAKDTENDNSTDSPSVEETTVDQTPSSEENKEEEATVESTEESAKESTGETTDESKQTKTKDDNDAGLAEHPRWKQREKDWKDRFNNQEERHTSDITKLREDFERRFSQSDGAKAAEDIPTWFGGDQQQWQEYLKWNQAKVDGSRDKTLEEVNSKSAGEQKAIADATQYFNDQVLDLEGETGFVIDRNKLLKFTLDNDLVDSQGRWNYKAAHRMMQSTVKNAKTKKLEKKKEIAGATTSEKKSESKPSELTTSKDFENPANRPW